jgi:hypothetical protein
MTEKELMMESINLRRKIFDEMREFWSGKDLDSEQVFFINSVVTASLVAHVTYLMFKKDIGNEPSLSYIDDICELAKKQFNDTTMMMGLGMQ